MLPDESQLRARMDATEPLTVGIEEEVLLLYPRTHELAPAAREVVAAADHPGIVEELPSCQLELVTQPHRAPADALAELAALRCRLLASRGDLRPAAAAVHPVETEAELAAHARRGQLAAACGPLARQQVVGALQVHVALGSADRTLAVFNALRAHLPELAALAAAAPFHGGVDSGVASVRPMVAGLLPRQGVPPPIASWSAHLDELRWGTRGPLVDEQTWWWEARPHLRHGTIEVRVADAQASIADAAAIVELVRALVGALSARWHDGERLDAAPSWRIAENRWQAFAHGIHGVQYDLGSGEARPTARVLAERIDEVEPWAPGGLDQARALLARPGADRLRAVGPDRAAAVLADEFAP